MFARCSRGIKLQVELRMLKRKKSLLPAKEVVYVIFSKMKAASEVANAIVVPGFSLRPLSLQWSPPCLAPSQMLLMLEGGQAEPWLLASCACPPHGWAMSSLCPASPSSLRSLFSLLANRMNLAGNICLWDLFNLEEITLYFQRGDENWQSQHGDGVLDSLC